MGRLVTEMRYMLPGSKLLAILAQKERLSGDDIHMPIHIA